MKAKKVYEFVNPRQRQNAVMSDIEIGPWQNKEISLKIQTAIGIDEQTCQIVPEDENEEEFMKVVEENGVKAEPDFYDPPNYPIIEYTGTVDQLIPVLELLNPFGYDEEEIKEIISEFDGDNINDLETYIEEKILY